MVKVLHSQSTLMIEDTGKVSISRIEEDDSVLGDFLSFLTNDIKKHPEHIRSINSALFSRANSLVSDIEIDLDAPLSEKDE